MYARKTVQESIFWSGEIGHLGCQMSSEADIFETMAWDQDIIRGKIKQMSDYNLNKQSGQKEVECPGHMR